MLQNANHRPSWLEKRCRRRADARLPPAFNLQKRAGRPSPIRQGMAVVFKDAHLPCHVAPKVKPVPSSGAPPKGGTTGKLALNFRGEGCTPQDDAPKGSLSVPHSRWGCSEPVPTGLGTRPQPQCPRVPQSTPPRFSVSHTSVMCSLPPPLSPRPCAAIYLAFFSKSPTFLETYIYLERNLQITTGNEKPVLQ